MTARDLFLKCITANKPRHNPADYVILVLNQPDEFEDMTCIIADVKINHENRTVTIVQDCE